MDYPNRNKTFYTGIKRCSEGVPVEYIHGTPYNPNHISHCWKLDLYYENITMA